MKVLIICRPDYNVYIEPCASWHMVHCDVFKWSATIRRELMRDFNTFRQLYGKRLFATHYPEQGNVHEKFLKTFGFTFLLSAKDADGVDCQIWAVPALDGSKGKTNG